MDQPASTKTSPVKNLIIPGAQKSGTTSLYNHLADHPDLNPSQRKEPDYFSNKNRLKTSDFGSLFRNQNSSSTIRFEASTSYLYHPHVPERVKSKLGNKVLFLIILRNPVKRAISAYWHLRKKFEDQRNFKDVFDVSTAKEQVLKIEEDRISRAESREEIDPSRFHQKYENPYWPFRYLQNSFYSDHLIRFTRQFPDDQIKLLLFEQFIENPMESLESVKNFLSLNKDFNLSTSKQHNKTKVPKTNFFHTLIHHLIRPTAKKLIGKPKWLTKLYSSLSYRDKPESPDKIERSLAKLFRKEQTLLQKEYGLATDRFWNLEEGN